MLRKEIDNKGLQCPQPVINTKKALDELAQQECEEFVLTSIVDNEAAKENVARFSETAGCKVDVEQKGELFYVIIKGVVDTKISEQQKVSREAELYNYANESSQGGKIFLFKSSSLGEGSEELGKLLMRSFIYTLKDTDSLPSKMLFLNSAVFLTTEGSPVLDELQELEKKQVEIFSCGTCLDYYQLKDKLQVGKITNMYDTLENILSSPRCISL